LGKEGDEGGVGRRGGAEREGERRGLKEGGGEAGKEGVGETRED